LIGAVILLARGSRRTGSTADRDIDRTRSMFLWALAVGAVGLAIAAIASPSARAHGHDAAGAGHGGSGGAHAHGGAGETADDLGYSALVNGQMGSHDHPASPATEPTLTPAETGALADQLAATAVLVERYPDRRRREGGRLPAAGPLLAWARHPLQRADGAPAGVVWNHLAPRMAERWRQPSPPGDRLALRGDHPAVHTSLNRFDVGPKCTVSAAPCVHSVDRRRAGVRPRHQHSVVPTVLRSRTRPDRRRRRDSGPRAAHAARQP
jgi:hypothetical protein